MQDHALALLRSGEVTTFPALLKRVLDDVRADTLLAAGKAGAGPNGDASSAAAAPTPASSKKGAAAAAAAAAAANGAAGTGAAGSLALPKAVVDDAVKITRDCLEHIVEIDDRAAL